MKKHLNRNSNNFINQLRRLLRKPPEPREWPHNRIGRSGESEKLRSQKWWA